jgi:hypothetical protein
MKQSPKREDVLYALHHLPRKIISVCDSDHGAAFVLHELCHPGCFNLGKVAYLVNNPDFNCLRGVAGIARNEPGYIEEISWEKPQEFSSYMNHSTFNGKVRDIQQSSVSTREKEQEAIHDIGRYLGFEAPNCYVWDLKHDNHGILLFENSDLHTNHEELLKNGIYYLNFCPLA